MELAKETGQRPSYLNVRQNVRDSMTEQARVLRGAADVRPSTAVARVYLYGAHPGERYATEQGIGERNRGERDRGDGGGLEERVGGMSLDRAPYREGERERENERGTDLSSMSEQGQPAGRGQEEPVYFQGVSRGGGPGTTRPRPMTVGSDGRGVGAGLEGRAQRAREDAIRDTLENITGWGT